MNSEKMTTCPITGGDACVVSKDQNGIETYFSFSSGYQTNSLMKKGEKFYEEQLELLPEIYKDLIWEDPNTQLVWIPSIINLPQKGMVFANGTDSGEWGWSAVQAIPVKEEEKIKYPIPNTKNQYYSFRMDMSTIKTFPKRDFIESLEYINFFDK
jgi:hypothetical protein